MKAEQIVGRSGVVRVEGEGQTGPVFREFVIAPISLAESFQLDDEIRAIAERERQERRQAELTMLSTMRQTWATTEAVKTVAASSLEPPTDRDLVRAEVSLQGTIMNLFYRCRKQHPKLSVTELNAIINRMNWPSVYDQMDAILSGGDKSDAGERPANHRPDGPLDEPEKNDVGTVGLVVDPALENSGNDAGRI